MRRRVFVWYREGVGRYCAFIGKVLDDVREGIGKVAFVAEV